MTEQTVPRWSISVTGVREEVFAALFEQANSTVHHYMQQLIAYYGTDTTAIATTADTALYQIRSGVATALGLLGSTVSAGGVARVDITGCASYQHAEADFVAVAVSNVPTNTGGSSDDTTTATPSAAVADTQQSSDETSAADTQTVEADNSKTAEETAE